MPTEDLRAGVPHDALISPGGAMMMRPSPAEQNCSPGAVFILPSWLDNEQVLVAIARVGTAEPFLNIRLGRQMTLLWTVSGADLIALYRFHLLVGSIRWSGFSCALDQVVLDLVLVRSGSSSEGKVGL